jgi:photosystem II stability/assembly factor-like uncharacterized protein
MITASSKTFQSRRQKASILVILFLILCLPSSLSQAVEQVGLERRSPYFTRPAPPFSSPLQTAGYRYDLIKQFEETSYYINDLDFVSPTVGWAVGYPHWDQEIKAYVGTIIKTINGGKTWLPQDLPSTGMLNEVDFVDTMQGWAVGAEGVILRTKDGGKHWYRQNSGTSEEMLSVAFVDNLHGWATSLRPTHFDAVGIADNWDASLWRTTDGGITWIELNISNDASILRGLDFIDLQTGWVVGVNYEGDDSYGKPIHNPVIYQTPDGGQTWIEQYNPDLQISLTNTDFFDARNGWAVGFLTLSTETGGAVFHTTDGGQTWERQEPGSFYDLLWDVQFIDAQRGYTVGANYIGAWGPPVWRTLDGGDSWEKVRMEFHELDGLFGLAISTNKVIALGDHDYKVNTERAWDSCEWTPPEPSCNDCDCLFEPSYINTHYNFEDVFFVNENLGWATGSRSFAPDHLGQIIMVTSDGGLTWKSQYEQPPLVDSLFSVFRLDGLHFNDSLNGWAAGRSADVGQYALLHTEDGGQHWIEQGQELFTGLDPEFFDVQFLNSQNGWALDSGHYDSLLGQQGLYLAHTTDGGGHWEWVRTGIAGSMSVGFADVQGELDFTDAQHGWAAGGLGKVIHTSDGGASWFTQDVDCGWPSCPVRFYAIEMNNNLEGWIAGEGLYQTSNGGDLWQIRDDVDVSGDFQDIQFVDAENGWLAGDKGMLFFTGNSGTTWESVTNPVSAVSIRGLSFINPHKGWLVGDYGTILTTQAKPYWPIYLPVIQR